MLKYMKDRIRLTQDLEKIDPKNNFRLNYLFSSSFALSKQDL